MVTVHRTTEILTVMMTAFWMRLRPVLMVPIQPIQTVMVSRIMLMSAARRVMAATAMVMASRIRLNVQYILAVLILMAMANLIILIPTQTMMASTML